MDVESLKKAYEAIEMLQALNLPLSEEQLKGVAFLEKKYLRENVIPAIKEGISPFFSSFRNPLKFCITYKPNEKLDYCFTNKQEAEANDDASLSTSNRTKYSFDGGKPLNKRRFVLAVVKKYVENHPQVTFDELETRFPPSLRGSVNHGVVGRYEEVMQRVRENPDLKNRYFLEPKDIITLYDGTKVVVSNQWGSKFPRFLEVASEMHSIEVFE